MDLEHPADILLREIKTEDGAHALTESAAMRSYVNLAKAVISKKCLNQRPSSALSDCIVINQILNSYVHRT